MDSQFTDILGLDWDGVISHFPSELRILIHKFSACVIITLNRSITLEQAAKVLGFPTNPPNLFLEICPDAERDEYAAWKAEMCLKHRVSLMIDDDGYVVMECRSRDIPTLAINAAFVQMLLFDAKI